jgi:hypothetical protein
MLNYSPCVRKVFMKIFFEKKCLKGKSQSQVSGYLMLWKGTRLGVWEGFYQSEGVDYTETSSPTIQDATLRLLLQYHSSTRPTDLKESLALE